MKDPARLLRTLTSPKWPSLEKEPDKFFDLIREAVLTDAYEYYWPEDKIDAVQADVDTLQTVWRKHNGHVS